MKKTVKLSVHETAVWQKILWIASQICDMNVVKSYRAESTKVQAAGGEIVATDLIVRADAHFVGSEVRNVPTRYENESTPASQNNERATSL